MLEGGSELFRMKEGLVSMDYGSSPLLIKKMGSFVGCLVQCGREF